MVWPIKERKKKNVSTGNGTIEKFVNIPTMMQRLIFFYHYAFVADLLLEHLARQIFAANIPSKDSFLRAKISLKQSQR